MADTSYLVEGILKRKELFEEDGILTPDLAIYEATNSIWKHQHLLKDLKDGSPYIGALFDLVESGAVTLVQFNESLVLEAYALALKHGASVYDTVFLSLAMETGLELKSFDREMNRLYRLERRKG